MRRRLQSQAQVQQRWHSRLPMVPRWVQFLGCIVLALTLLAMLANQLVALQGHWLRGAASDYTGALLQYQHTGGSIGDHLLCNEYYVCMGLTASAIRGMPTELNTILMVICEYSSWREGVPEIPFSFCKVFGHSALSQVAVNAAYTILQCCSKYS